MRLQNTSKRKIEKSVSLAKSFCTHRNTRRIIFCFLPFTYSTSMYRHMLEVKTMREAEKGRDVRSLSIAEHMPKVQQI